MREPLRLLMFSGGADSTYLLYHYLVNTDYDVHVHRINMKNTVSNRWRQEDVASDGIIQYCLQHFRPIHGYSKTEYEFKLPRIGFDTDIIVTVASHVALNLIEKDRGVIVGYGMAKAYDLDTNVARQARIKNLWTACRLNTLSLFLHKDRHLLLPLDDFEYPILNTGKNGVLDKLPKELLDLTWSCRDPKFGKQCGGTGNCEPCEDIKKWKESKNIIGE